MLTKQQKIERQSGIGGSDVAGILGVSNWATPYSVWKSKVDPVSDEDDTNESMYWGNVLEDVVRQEFAKRTGLTVIADGKLHRHPDYPWMLANVDGEIEGLNEGLEIKTASEFAGKGWGSDSDSVPEYYLTQGMHYCAVRGWDAVHFAVLIGGNKYRQYRVEADPELIADLIEMERAFWHDYVLPKIPPPMTAEECLMANPRSTAGALVEASQPVVAACRKLQELKKALKEIETEAGKAEATIKEAIGSNEGLVLDGKTIATWKNNKDKTVFDADAFEASNPDLYQKFVKTAPGARVLRLKEI
jgi:putative phage-type endonuclease